MSMMNIFNVSGSAISAQSQRLNVVASKFSETARKQIEAAGGSCQEIQ